MGWNRFATLLEMNDILPPKGIKYSITCPSHCCKAEILRTFDRCVIIIVSWDSRYSSCIARSTDRFQFPWYLEVLNSSIMLKPIIFKFPSIMPKLVSC